MSRYIDIKAFDDWYDDGYDLYTYYEALHNAPSIDIVRCKECRHRPVKEGVNGADYGFNLIAPNGDTVCPCLIDDGWYSWMPEDDFYCGYGERSE